MMFATREKRAGAKPTLPVTLRIAAVWSFLSLATGLAAAAPKHAALLIDANTGQVLHDHAGDEPRHPASLTKMMTIYMALEQIELGRLTYETKIVVSEKAAAVAPSKLDLEPGESIRLVDAIKVLIVKSANDIAVAVAEAIGGTEANFARLMTARARQIGMPNTTFRNASGLPDPDQITTGRDMVTLALRLQDDFPRHYGLFGTRSFTYNGKTYRNHNKLLATLGGTDGIKTGYTRASGFNLVSSVRRGGKHIVGVIFGGRSGAIRNANMRMLLTSALNEASAEKTRKPVVVARAAPMPKLATAPARRPVWQAEPDAAVPKPVAVAVQEPRAVASANNVAIAKVRRVLVAPRVVTAATAKATTEEDNPRQPRPQPPAFATASTAPPVWKAAATDNAPAGRRPPDAIGLLLSSAPPAAERAPAVRQPGTLGQQSAALAVASPAPQPAPPRADPIRAQIEAAPPSPVAAAAPLVNPRPAVYARAGTGASAPRSVAAAGGFQIQIGAFQTAAEAQRRLESAQTQAGAVLSGREALTQKVQKGERELFRARFAGFDAPSAASACAELKRRQMDCFVMKTE